MKRKYNPIKTPLGIANGRDAIYLDNVAFSNRTNTLTLDLGLNIALCSDSHDDEIDFSSCQLRFNGVLATLQKELDSWDWESESSFDEILESSWIMELGGKVTSRHKHYLLQTYDDVFEVVCENYEFLPTNTEQVNSSER